MELVGGRVMGCCEFCCQVWDLTEDEPEDVPLYADGAGLRVHAL